MSVINTNITSMIGQSNLSKSQNALQTSMERLSSGLRINSAKDDAAGQAIANRMTAQITGLSQAQRNANDGISVSQTAEGALNQVNDNLQRIRELSVQAANGTNSSDDLTSIQDEINQRLGEIDRISEETNFNGVRVLSSDSELKIQVGANDGETISVNLQEINADTDFNVNGYVTDVSGSVQTALNLSSANFGSGSSEASSLSAATASISLPSGYSSGALVADQDGNFFVSATETATSSTVYFTANVNVEQNDDGVVVENGIKVTVGSEVAGQRSENPLEKIDAALNKVDSLRSELGAVQNRFESAITNLNTNETNLSSARSRIEDADMTRAQILQQAGTSVLAQANQIPQNVLSLLG